MTTREIILWIVLIWISQKTTWILFRRKHMTMSAFAYETITYSGSTITTVEMLIVTTDSIG
jgi:hypothetical protein